MLTAANSYLLWAFTWIQFVVTVATFSYRGLNLLFYVENAPPFDHTLPELFLGFSVALSLFAITAITGATCRTPRFWKRLLTVGIFAAIGIGFSCLNLHLRHYSYASAILAREMHQAMWIRLSRSHVGDTDSDLQHAIEEQRRWMDQYATSIALYEKKYGITPRR